MYDRFNVISMILRSLALIPLAAVFLKQAHLMTGSNYRKTKIALLLIFALTIFNNGFTIWANFYRNEDGNLVDWMRQLSQVLNATTALAQAWGWCLLYFNNDKDEGLNR